MGNLIDTGDPVRDAVAHGEAAPAEFAAVGCRLLVVPSGALYEMDWDTAHLDNDWIDHSRKIAPYLRSRESTETLFHLRQGSEIQRYAIRRRTG